MVYEQKLQFLELIQPFSYSKTDPARQLAKLRYQSGITSANEEEIELSVHDLNWALLNPCLCCQPADDPRRRA